MRIAPPTVLSALLPATCLVATCLLAIFLSGGSAAAEEDRTTWAFRKGTEWRDVDVTHMSPDLRKAIVAQLAARGWSRAQRPVPAPDRAATATGVASPLSPSTRKDLRALAEGGGVLPKGFRPDALAGPAAPDAEGASQTVWLAAMGKAVGLVVLRYLEVREDPLRGPVYEAVLRSMARSLVDKAGPAKSPRDMAAELVARVTAGMGDPAKAPVYGEILQLLQRGWETPADPPRRIECAGATFVSRAAAAGGASRFQVTAVGDGSRARKMGLRTGDVIQKVAGRRATADALRKAFQPSSQPGKLSIEVMRKDGKIERLELEFEVVEQTR